MQKKITKYFNQKRHFIARLGVVKIFGTIHRYIKPWSFIKNNCFRALALELPSQRKKLPLIVDGVNFFGTLPDG